MAANLGAGHRLAAALVEFSYTAWPTLPCPFCYQESLAPENVQHLSTQDSINHSDSPDWEPDWEFGYFHGTLRCGYSKCREIVVVSGEMRHGLSEEWDDPNDGRSWTYWYRLRYSIPSIPLTDRLPDGCPESVVLRIREAGRIFWADPAGSANRLRSALEELLNVRRVRRIETTSTGKRRRLSLHRRIQILGIGNPEVAELIEAVKWIGNEGSHSSEIDASNVLLASVILEHALFVMYDRSTAEIAKQARAVNRRRRV